MSSLTLGFGSCEKQEESRIESMIREKVEEQFTKDQTEYCTKEFAEKVRHYVRSLSDISHKLGDKYKVSTNHPDRYSYFWPTVISDANYLVFILRFNHINRRHPLSPDGWAALASDTIFYIDLSEREKKGGA